MALNAVHIRARALSPEADHITGAAAPHHDRSHAETSASAQRRSASPTPTSTPRPGLGSSSVRSIDQEHYRNEWHSLRTGEPLAAKALRMRHRFVRATSLSDPSLAAPLAQAEHQEASQNWSSGATLPSEALATSAPTLAQLYSQLAEDAPTQHLETPASRKQIHIDATALLQATNSTDSHYHALGEQNHRAHRHRHQSGARHRSDWFISRAFKKLQHSRHTSSSKGSALLDPNQAIDPKEDAPVDQTAASSSRGRRCPRCGDTLPPGATPEYMARHRQSIGHRLGLNAPVSSASASEAPSPNISEPSTPVVRSRSTSPVAVPGPFTQPSSIRSTRLPRRLSNAPRWKKIAGDNVGHSLLSRMGWKEGMGLGVQEWKWQQLRREKEKRLRSAAVRSLLPRRETVTASSNEIGAESQTAFPFGVDMQDAEEQRVAAEAWLSSLVETEAEWIQHLTMEERQSLEHALLSGQVTVQDVQDALSIDADIFVPNLFSPPQPDPAISSQIVPAEADDEAMQSNTLLYPVEVELRNDRSGIGVKRPSHPSALLHRRSRAAEGNVEIRRRSSTSESLGDEHKKLRFSSASRPFKAPGRSRSRSSSTKDRSQGDTQADLTRRQRELAYQREKHDWLDLRASLS